MSAGTDEMRPLRIAILSWESRHSIAVGGLSAHVSDLAAALARRGHQVHVFTRPAAGQSPYERVGAVHYHRCAYDGHPDLVSDANRMSRSFVRRLGEVEAGGGPFDVVHGHDWHCARALARVRLDGERPTVLTMHSTEFGRCGNQLADGLSRRIRELEWQATFVADRVICVSRALRQELRRLYAVPADKLAVVYNGVDLGRFEARADGRCVRRRYGLAPDDPLVLFAGRLVWQKGPDLLLDALPGILYRQPRAKVVFAGDGTMRAELVRRAAAIGVAAATRFVGRLASPELVGLYQGADLVCVPSRNEPFGIVILEAWGAGTPVVTTGRGGPAEFVHHGHTGLTVADNVGSIGWGVSSLLGDAEGRRRMGANGRREAATRFSWSSIARETERVYQALVRHAGIRERHSAFLTTEDPRMARQRTDKAAGTTTRTRKSAGQASRRSAGGTPGAGPPKSKSVPEVIGFPEPSPEDIRRRAYEIFLARQGLPGDPVADWLQAERELRAQLRWQAQGRPAS